MPTRRRRLAMLRVFGPRPPHATDEPNGPGMDAPPEPHDAGRDAARPRSAPAFCVPQPVPPKPYRPPARGTAGVSSAGAAPLPYSADRSTRKRFAPDTVAVEPRIAFAERPVSHALPRYEAPRREALRTAGPYSSDSEGRSAASVRPMWEDRDESEDEEPAGQPAAGPAWTALARGVALLFGTLLAIDLFAEGGLPEGGSWWLDTRPLPDKVAAGLLGLGAAVLIVFGVRPRLPGPVRAVGTVCLVLLIALALKNATVYYGLLQRGDLHAGPPVAFPLHVAACLGVVLFALRSAPRPGGLGDLVLTLLGFNAALLSLSVAQIACCGPVDARRPAAAAVVLGPRPFEVDADARLDERLKTAVELYETALVPKLVLAGGSSGERLARLTKMATDGGVPESAISVLPAGDEASTIREVARQFPEAEGKRPTLLAVGDIDQLPRFGLDATKAGVNVFTVPTKGTPGREVLVREVVELWRTYLRR